MREIKLRVKILRPALPDSACQPIILTDGGRRFPTARGSAHSASSPAYSQVARAHGCGL